MKCKYCGKEIDEGSLFCCYCGKKLPKTKACIKCSQEIGLDDAFCGFCGAPQKIKEDVVSVITNEQGLEEEYQTPPTTSHQDTILETPQNMKGKAIDVAGKGIDVIMDERMYAAKNTDIVATSQENAQISKEDKESVVKEKKPIHKWLLAIGIITISIIGIIVYNYKTNSTGISNISEKESLDVIRNFAKSLKRYRNGYSWSEIEKLSYGAFCNGLARVEDEGGHGYINMKGEEVVPCIYADAEDFREGMAMVILDGKCGFINTKGEVVIPFTYYPPLGVTSFNDGLMAVSKGGDGDNGYINKKGEEVIPCNLNHVESFSEELAVISKDGKRGFINKKGEEIIPCIYDDVRSFKEGLALMRKGNWENGKYGYINKKGEEIIPCIYDDASDFSEGLARVRKGDEENGKYGYINRKGEVVIPPSIYVDAANFCEGLAVVGKGDRNGWGSIKYGYINKKGEEVIPFIYDLAGEMEGSMPVGNFSGGLAAVCRDGKWGYINKQGKEVIPLIYDGAFDFSEGLGRVEKNGSYGYIDKYGHCTLDY